MTSKILLIGILIVAGTSGAPHEKRKEKALGDSKNQVDQNVKVNQSSFVDKQPSGQSTILLNQQHGNPNQQFIITQPSNQQAILVTNPQNQQPLLVQNPNQQTIFLTNPQVNQPSSKPIYVQQPNQQPTVWLVSQTNTQPNQVLLNQPTSSNQPVILVPQPNQQPILISQQPMKTQENGNQPSNNKPIIIQQPHQQPLLFISSSSNKQPDLQNTNQPYNNQLGQPTIWIASQENQPAIFVNQQNNQPATEGIKSSVPAPMFNLGQGTYITSQPGQGNVVILPYNKNNPEQASNTYYVPI